MSEPARRDGARPPPPGPPGCRSCRLPGQPHREGHHPPGRPQARVSCEAPRSRPGVRATFRRRRNFFGFPISKFFRRAREFLIRARTESATSLSSTSRGVWYRDSPVFPGIVRFLEPEPVLPFRRDVTGTTDRPSRSSTRVRRPTRPGMFGCGSPPAAPPPVSGGVGSSRRPRCAYQAARYCSIVMPACSRAAASSAGLSVRACPVQSSQPLIGSDRSCGSGLALPVHQMPDHPGPVVLDVDVAGASREPPVHVAPLLGPVDQRPEHRLGVTSPLQQPPPLVPKLRHELALAVVSLALGPPPKCPLRRLESDRIEPPP